MLRSLWQRFKNFIYNEPTEEFKTQEEIDIDIENEILDSGAAILYNDTPQGANQRKRTFLNHKDAMAYASTIPSEYVTYVIVDDYDEDGNRGYEVWVQE